MKMNLYILKGVDNMSLYEQAKKINTEQDQKNFSERIALEVDELKKVKEKGVSKITDNEIRKMVEDTVQKLVADELKVAVEAVPEKIGLETVKETGIEAVDEMNEINQDVKAEEDTEKVSDE